MSTAENNSILVVDTIATETRALVETLQREGYRVLQAQSAENALAQAQQALPVAMLLEPAMREIDGLELCRKLQSHAATAGIAVIFLASSGEDKARGFAAGGADCLMKPLELQELLARLRLHVEVQRLRRSVKDLTRLKERLLHENRYLHQEVREQANHREMIGSSAALREVVRQTELLAQASGAMLIHGEVGTGKELLARLIHERSPRGQRAFIKFDCSSVAARAVEAELFGQRSAGAPDTAGHRLGRAELADGGTLFIDAVNELPPTAQERLLRLLQSGTCEPLGSADAAQVDVRVIAASHRDLQGDVASGRFRADLYQSLSAAVLRVPALRERAEDIPALAQYFLERSLRKLGKTLHSIEPETLTALQGYFWPGNIRDLQSTIERAAILAGRDGLRIDLPRDAGQGAHEGGFANHAASGNGGAPIYRLVELERQHFITVLKKTRGVIEGPHGAARLLDLKPSTARFRIKKLGIRREDFDARLAPRNPPTES